MSDENEEQMETLEEELIERLKQKEQALEKLAEDMDTRLKDYQDLPSGIGDQVTRLEQEIQDLEKRANRPGHGPSEGASETQEDAEYRKAFDNFLRRGIEAPELRALETDDPTKGGYVVPQAMQKAMIDELVEISPIRAFAAQQTITQGDALDVPIDEGGWGQGWVGERGDRSETTTGTLGMRRVALREQYAFPHVSQRMLDDAGINVEQWLGRKLAEKFAQEEGKQFVTGDDVLQPQGIIAEAERTGTEINVKETASSGALDTDDVLDVLYEPKTGYARNARLFANRKINLALRKLKDDNSQYLWQPSVAGGEPPTFAGVPISEVPDMDAAVSAGNHVLMFADLSRSYQIVDKSTVAMLRDPYTNKPHVGFYTTRRVGGRVILPEAITVSKVKA